MLADLARSRDAKARFQEVFHEATARWATGEDDSAYGESFPDFVARCLSYALHHREKLIPLAISHTDQSAKCAAPVCLPFRIRLKAE